MDLSDLSEIATIADFLVVVTEQPELGDLDPEEVVAATLLFEVSAKTLAGATKADLVLSAAAGDADALRTEVFDEVGQYLFMRWIKGWIKGWIK